MKMNVHISGFKEMFFRHGRAGQFSNEALDALYDFYEEQDPEYVLDVLGICRDWVEYPRDEAIRFSKHQLFGSVKAIRLKNGNLLVRT